MMKEAKLKVEPGFNQIQTSFNFKPARPHLYSAGQQWEYIIQTYYWEKDCFFIHSVD